MNKVVPYISLIFFVVGIVNLIIIPDIEVRSIPDLKDRVQLKNEIRGTFVTILGGGMLLVGLYLTWRRITSMDKHVKVMEDNLELSRKSFEQSQEDTIKTLEISQQSQISDRFIRAIDQLGATREKEEINLEVRLGGIYTLERIARESIEYHAQIMEILTAYVRQRARWDGDEPEDGKESTKSDENININNPSFCEVPADIQAIMKVLGRRNWISKEKDNGIYINLKNTDLRGINMWSAQLNGVNFMYSNLDYANFDKSNLRGTFFTKASLQNASFIDANLKEAYFGGAMLDGAEFRNVNMSLEDDEIAAIRRKSAADKGVGHFEQEPFKFRGNFMSASLQNARFESAKLKHVVFRGANLKAARFSFAFLQGADFGNTNLENADFEYADFRNANLEDAYCAGANFTDAKLDETNFRGVKGITGGMLSDYQCTNAAGLDPDLLNGV